MRRLRAVTDLQAFFAQPEMAAGGVWVVVALFVALIAGTWLSEDGE